MQGLNCISYLFNLLFYFVFKICNYFILDHRALRFCLRLFIYYPNYYFSIPIQTLFHSLLTHTRISPLECFNNKNKVPMFTITNKKNISKNVLSILYIHGDEYTSRRMFCTELYHRIQKKFPNRKIEIHIPLYRSLPKYSIENSLNDIANVLQCLKKKTDNLWMIADSFGALVAVQLATELSELDCSGIVLLSPITNLDSIKSRTKVKSSTINSLDVIPISIPIYIFFSDNESCRDDSRELYRINRHTRLYEIPDTVHLFPLFWHIHEKGNCALTKIVTLVN